MKCCFVISPSVDGEPEGLCGHELNSAHTGNMAYHISSAHGITESDWAETKAAKMREGLTSFLVSGKIILSKEELKEQQCMLGVALANDLLPVSIFQEKKSRSIQVGSSRSGEPTSIDVPRWDLGSWLSCLVPQFKPGFYQTIQTRVNELNDNELKQDVKFLISKMISVGFTSDAFTSQSRLHFHSVTGHGVIFFRQRLMFISLLLANKAFKESDAEAESRYFLDVCEDWDIPESRRSGVTVDGAELAMAQRAQLRAVWCPLHWLQLGIHDVLQWPSRSTGLVSEEELHNYPLFQRQSWELIDNNKKMVTVFSTPKALGQLRDAHDRLKSSSRLVVPKQCNDTRWSSEYIMMESLQECRSALEEYFRIEGKQRTRPLSKTDFDISSEFLYVLAPARHVTTLLQSWDFPCSLEIWPSFFRCQIYWLTKCGEQQLSSALAKEFAQGILNACMRRGAEVFAKNPKVHYALMAFSPFFWVLNGNVFRIAEIIDQHIHHFGRFIPGVITSGKGFVDKVFSEMITCVTELAPTTLGGCCDGAYLSPAKMEVQRQPVRSEQQPPHKRAHTEVFEIFHSQLGSGSVDETGFTSSVIEEGRKFVSLLQKSAELDVLSVFQRMIDRNDCPRFVHVALFFLSIPGSNASSESVFSDTGFVTSDRRARTGAEWAETQVAIHRNFDTIKKIRALVGALPEQSLEDAWANPGDGEEAANSAYGVYPNII